MENYFDKLRSELSSYPVIIDTSHLKHATDFSPAACDSRKQQQLPRQGKAVYFPKSIPRNVQTAAANDYDQRNESQQVYVMQMQEALQAQCSEAQSSAKEHTAASRPKLAKDKTQPLAGIPSHVLEFSTSVSKIVGTMISQINEEGASTIVKGMETTTNVFACVSKLSRLVPGSDPWFREIRIGCALCDAGVFLDYETELLGVVLKLASFSWESDGGSMVALQAHPLLEALWKLHQKYPNTTSLTAVQIMADVWTGLARRLCNVQLLNYIDVTARQWCLAVDDCFKLQQRKLLISCELEAAEILSLRTSRTSLYYRSQKQFARKFEKILATLLRLFNSDSEGQSGEEALFLAAQMIVFGKNLPVVANENLHQDVKQKQSADQKNSADVSTASSTTKQSPETISTDLEKILHRSSTALREAAYRSSNPLGRLSFDVVMNPSVQMKLDRDDVFPCFARDVLRDFDEEQASRYPTATPNDWDLWICTLKRTEDFWARMSQPTYRGVPGFWLDRDRQLERLEEFGKVYATRMPLKDITSVLDSTPTLRAIMCSEKRQLVWPHTVLQQASCLH